MPYQATEGDEMSSTEAPDEILAEVLPGGYEETEVGPTAETTHSDQTADVVTSGDQSTEADLSGLDVDWRGAKP
jgi:hypothetical protein